jgi:hypothetical protein
MFLCPNRVDGVPSGVSVFLFFLFKIGKVDTPGIRVSPVYRSIGGVLYADTAEFEVSVLSICDYGLYAKLLAIQLKFIYTVCYTFLQKLHMEHFLVYPSRRLYISISNVSRLSKPTVHCTSSN